MWEDNVFIGPITPSLVSYRYDDQYLWSILSGYIEG